MDSQPISETQVRQILDRELQPIRQEAAQQAQARVYASLNAQVPGWEQINESAAFLSWLEGFEVVSNSSRHAALLDAFHKHDASRVVGIFKAYQSEAGVEASSGRQGAPGESRRKIWSEAEIKSFYERARKKQVTPEEYQRISTELAAAAREGRIRPDRIEPV